MIFINEILCMSFFVYYPDQNYRNELATKKRFNNEMEK